MAGNIKHTRVTSTNDADFTALTCGEGKLMELLQVHVEYTSSATVGNRQISILIRDEDSNLVGRFLAGGVQAASLVRFYTGARGGIFRETSFEVDHMFIPVPMGTVLLPSWTLSIKDDAEIALAEDDVVVSCIYQETNHNDGDAVL